MIAGESNGSSLRGEGRAVCNVDAAGNEVAHRAPIATKVIQLLPRGELLIVREDYYHFPSGRSNLYCLDHDLRVMWTAELPTPTDAYSGPVFDKGEILECAAWEGDTCDIDPQTGKIVQKRFTK